MIDLTAYVDTLDGRPVGVFGLGASGRAAVEALTAAGARTFAWDDAEQGRKWLRATNANAAPVDEWPWEDMAFVVLSPGVPHTHPKPHPAAAKAKETGVEIIGDMELFARAIAVAPVEAHPRVVAVTGSNGKSTTTALIGHILREAGVRVHVGGNIGEAVLALPELEAGSVYVLELSSFQLDLVHTFRADVAVLLNFSVDHIDRHGDMAGYVASKKRIFDNQIKADTAVIGVDDAYAQAVCTELMARNGRTIMPISSEAAVGKGVFALDGKVFVGFDGKTRKIGDISGVASLAGAHNWQNAAAAVAATRALGVSPDRAVDAMARFQGLPHRLERVAVRNGVAFVNDSKATNAESASKALAAFRDIFWIAGGKPKEGGVAALRGQLNNVRRVYLIGEAAAQFEAQLAGAADILQCGTLEKAVAAAAKDAAASGAKGAVVLLSPACASYDQFRNFEHRGLAFREAVARLDQPSANGEAA